MSWRLYASSQRGGRQPTDLTLQAFLVTARLAGGS
jgi:hypothetical protein